MPAKIWTDKPKNPAYGNYEKIKLVCYLEQFLPTDQVWDWSSATSWLRQE